VTTTSWAGLAGDHHVHSTFSDDAESTLVENIAAARAVGLTQLRLVDHVRESTTWVPEFLAAVAGSVGEPAVDRGGADRLSREQRLRVLTGVEAKILDATGRLDLPPDLRTAPGRADRVDRVLIADHQYPGPQGPWSPARVLAERASGLTTATVLDTLIEATIRSLHRVEHAQVAHLFSLLPKVGLTEDDLDDDHLAALADAALMTGAWVEVNEKWACPSARVVSALQIAGVTLVASTDSHHCRDVGRYRAVVDLTRGLTDERAAPGGRLLP
jgi:putative hydrolase